MGRLYTDLSDEVVESMINSSKADEVIGFIVDIREVKNCQRHRLQTFVLSNGVKKIIYQLWNDMIVRYAGIITIGRILRIDYGMVKKVNFNLAKRYQEGIVPFDILISPCTNVTCHGFHQ